MPHATITGELLESGCAAVCGGEGAPGLVVSDAVVVDDPSPTSSRVLVFGEYVTVLPTLKERFMREKGLQVDEGMSRR